MKNLPRYKIVLFSEYKTSNRTGTILRSCDALRNVCLRESELSRGLSSCIVEIVHALSSLSHTASTFTYVHVGRACITRTRIVRAHKTGPRSFRRKTAKIRRAFPYAVWRPARYLPHMPCRKFTRWKSISYFTAGRAQYS